MSEQSSKPLVALPPVRRQATLFLTDQPQVEHVRRTFNPEQAGLISAHVTLCREDEVDDWNELASRLSSLTHGSVTLEFGAPVREHNLVYLPCTAATREFDELREQLLSSPQRSVRVHKPHVTLIHPRNGQCDDGTFAEILKFVKPFRTTLNEVSLIEQCNGGIWQVLEQFRLGQSAIQRPDVFGRWEGK